MTYENRRPQEKTEDAARRFAGAGWFGAEMPMEGASQELGRLRRTSDTHSSERRHDVLRTARCMGASATTQAHSTEL